MSESKTAATLSREDQWMSLIVQHQEYQTLLLSMMLSFLTGDEEMKSRLRAKSKDQALRSTYGLEALVTVREQIEQLCHLAAEIQLGGLDDNLLHFSEE